MPERLRTGGIVLLPGLAAIALLIYWAAHEGGYPPTTWLPSALVVLGLLVATVVGIGPDRIRVSRPLAIALAALGAYTAWSYLSLLWAAAPGEALEGSNRTLLYLLLFALFALLPWRPWTARAALSVFALGIGVIAIVQLVRIGAGDGIAGLFHDARLVTPVGYVNGAAALYMIGSLSSCALASRRELPALLRGVLLAGAVAALQAAILCESRGWLFALGPVLLVAFVIVPGRVRLALWMLPVAAGALLPLRALLDVFERPDMAPTPAAAARALRDAAAHAGDVALPICAAALLLGILLALFDRRVSVSPRAAARGSAVAGAIAGIAAIGAIAAVFIATDGRPDQTIADYWERSSSYQETEPGTSRFSAVGSNRPDFWRVSLAAVGDHPILGLGQDNWGDYYLRHRDSDEQPRWTHSLELRLLAHTGIAGFLLFAVFLTATAIAALLRRRRGGRQASAAAAIALLPAVVWLVHGSVDWFWEIPALSGPAFAFLGLGGALMRGDDGAPEAPEGNGASRATGNDDPTGAPARSRSRGRRAARRALLGAGALTALAAAAVLALPYAAARDTSTAASRWTTHPNAALDRLERAAELNPLSARPALIAGAIALQLERPATARERFRAALERSPENWFVHFGLGLTATAAGERGRARAHFRRARALNPHEPLIAEALKRLDGRRPLTYAEAFAVVRRDVRALTGDS